MNTTTKTEAETVTTQTTRAALLETANAQMAAYPQYRGHFDGYSVGRIKRDVRTKMGLAFAAGERVLFIERKSFLPSHGFKFVTAYSSRNKVDTSVPACEIEAV